VTTVALRSMVEGEPAAVLAIAIAPEAFPGAIDSNATVNDVPWPPAKASGSENSRRLSRGGDQHKKPNHKE